MSEKLYPLGTVVYLKEGTEKLMVIGRGVVYQDQETNSEMFVDYMGCLYPSGINPNNTIFFIKKILIELFSKVLWMKRKNVS